MKTIFHKVFYTIGGCTLGVVATVLLLVIIALSEREHSWLFSPYRDIVPVAVFLAFVITGGGIGYRKCVHAIQTGRVSYRQPLVVLCTSVVLTFMIIWAGRYIQRTYFPDLPMIDRLIIPDSNATYQI